MKLAQCAKSAGAARMVMQKRALNASRTELRWFRLSRCGIRGGVFLLASQLVRGSIAGSVIVFSVAKRDTGM